MQNLVGRVGDPPTADRTDLSASVRESESATESLSCKWIDKNESVLLLPQRGSQYLTKVLESTRE